MFEFIKNLISHHQKEILLITPNQRLANHISQQFDYFNKNSNHTFWQIPPIYSFSQWQEQFWLEFQDDSRVLLNTYQELLLWEQSINASDSTSNSLINKIKNAFDILQKWQVSIDHLKSYHYREVAYFYNSAEKFHKLSKKYVCKSRLTKIITDLVEQNHIRLPYIPKNIILLGFDDFSLAPLEKMLLKTLESHGHKIEQIEFRCQKSQQHRISFKDQNNEIVSMALWAKDRLKKNPNASIACVVPNLTELRSQVERIFTEIFSPQVFLSNNNDSIPFNISVGKVFTDYTIINTAFKILNLGNSTLDLENLVVLLHSPYIANSVTENIERTFLAAKLQNINLTQITYEEILKFIENTSFCLGITNILQNHAQSLKQSSGHRSHAEWALFFTQQLQNFAWPQTTTLNSEEYQALKRWEKLLHEFASLDLISPRISHDTALQQINQLAIKIIFQPKKELVAINILGILETTGMNFDHMWVMGMNNQCWPPPANPNPFIPVELQKKLQIPHACAERELYFCQILTNRFCHSAEEVIFSHATMIDKQQYKASALIHSIPEKSFAEFNLHHTSLAEQIFASKKLEAVSEGAFIPMQKNENITASGDLFKLQSLCPFRAFAKYRLQAKSLDESYENTLRGKFVHKILEQIWQQIQTHENLIHLTAFELDAIISTAINNCIKADKNTKFSKRNFSLENIIITENYIKLEKICLHELITKWLEFEKSRTPFKILALEKPIETYIGNLKIKLRLDRIDLLEDNKAIILDYKTGKKMPVSNDWTTNRPEDPQLPLYYCAVANVINEAIEGVLIANLNIIELNTTKKKFLHGKAKNPKKIHNENNLKNLNIETEINWEELTAKWQTTIENLAQDFCNGHAKVDPLDSKKSCEFCDLHALCRIKESLRF